MACPFCARIAASDVTTGNALAVAFPDAFPLTPGHTLVVPRRHEPDFLALSGEERQAVLTLAVEVAARLRAERAPDGYNLGVNVGPAGGQTVPHAHLHVIPRYRGDVADPRGGIRWIIPQRARYWEAT
jgi:diadenosine tetraphosphate (Ap4A) HIT family hydrolase